MARKLHSADAAAPVITTEGDTDELVRLALLAADSTSRFEDRHIDAALETLCRRHLDRGDDSDIEAALSRLKASDSPGYDELLAMAEDCAQTRLDDKGSHLLVLIPIMGWSRYAIPFGPTEATSLMAIAALYQKTWAPESDVVTIGNCLIAADSLPERLTEVRGLLDALTEGRQKTGIASITSFLKADPPADFADVRYLAVAVSASEPAKLFPPLSQDYREHARRMMDFCLGVREILMTPMAGTMTDVQPPAAFFSGWRQTDAAMRVFCIRALVNYVSCMGYEPADLVATTAVFTRVGGLEQTMDTDEVRVSISRKSDLSAVIAGVVLPTIPEESEQNQAFAGEVLRDMNVGRIAALPQTFPMEWCDDCGAPLYANCDGYVRHLETPPDFDEKNFAPTLN